MVCTFISIQLKNIAALRQTEEIMFSRKSCSIVLAIMMLFSIFALPVMAENSQSNVFEITYNRGEGYTVTFNVSGEESVVDDDVTCKFPEGTTVTATIQTEEGYRIASVKANNITMPGAAGKTNYELSDLESKTSIIITVEKLQKALVTVVNPGAHYIYTFDGVDTEGKAYIGSTVTLRITPDEGYKVSKIILNGSEVPAGNTYTFTVSEINNFQIVVVEEFISDQKHLIIEPTTGGTVTANGELFTAGSTVTLTLTPNTGYMLSSLKLNDTAVSISSVSNNKYSFTITTDTVVKAEFVKIVTVNVQAGKGGTVSINGKEVGSTSVTKVPEGSDVVISVSASLGYVIDTVTVDGTPVELTDNSFTIPAIDATKKVVVTFKAADGIKQYTITATAGPGGIITPSNQTTVEEGQSITFVITPDPGKEVDTVKVDGNVVSLTNNTYTFSNVAASHTITVTFKDAAPTDNPGGNGGVVQVSDVNWNADIIVIDIKTKTLISADVFKKITNDIKDKTVIFEAKTYKWVLPKGASVSISAESANVALQTNNTLYAEVSSAVSAKKSNAKVMLYSYDNSVQFPEGTVLEIMLPNNFVSQEVQHLIYDPANKTLSNPKNELGDKALDIRTVASDCWVSLNYRNDSNIVVCDVLTEYHTINIILNVGGSVLPSNKLFVEKGGAARFRVTADEGYVINSLVVGTTEDTDAQGKASYDKVLQQVTADLNVTVSFRLAETQSSEESSSGSSSLIVALIIIALAAAGGATLFIIKLRQEKY